MWAVECSNLAALQPAAELARSTDDDQGYLASSNCRAVRCQALAVGQALSTRAAGLGRPRTGRSRLPPRAQSDEGPTQLCSTSGHEDLIAGLVPVDLSQRRTSWIWSSPD